LRDNKTCDNVKLKMYLELVGETMSKYTLRQEWSGFINTL
jgi:hypothetical protein